MLALAPLLALAAAPLPLERCEAVPLDFHGWQYACGDIQMKIADDTAPFTREFWEGLELAIAADFGEGAVRDTTRIRLGGQEVDADRTTRGDGKRTVWVISRRRPEGERLLLCFGPGDGRACLPMLDVLEASAWRSGPVGGARRGDPGLLTLAGRPVRTPAGCAAERAPFGGSVVCGATSFVNWVEFADETAAERRAEAMRTAASNDLLRNGAEASEDEVDCRIAGIPSTCVRYQAQVGGGHLVVIVGVAHGATWAAANCTSMGSSLAGGACGAVFADR